jgi:hypothetical protein
MEAGVAPASYFCNRQGVKTAMKVMVLVKATPESEAGEPPDEELLTKMMDFNEQLVEAGVMRGGDGLKPSSEGVRVRFDGASRVVTDGPFADTRELVAGYWLWEVESMAEAVEWAKKCPNPMRSASDLEIRPVFEMEDFGDIATPALREQEARLRQKTEG